MPRPRKCRKVCQLPAVRVFAPLDAASDCPPVVMTVDEYETIRLVDHQGFSQENCGRYMNIARTTVQQIYTAARKKLADALVEGRGIRIEGGDYQLCSGDGAHCGCGGCRKRLSACCHTQKEDAL